MILRNVRDFEGDFEALAVWPQAEPFTILLVHAHLVEQLVGLIDAVLTVVRFGWQVSELIQIEGLEDFRPIDGQAQRLSEPLIPSDLAPVFILQGQIEVEA